MKIHVKMIAEPIIQIMPKGSRDGVVIDIPASQIGIYEKELRELRAALPSLMKAYEEKVK
jgi:hypothetical protein